MSEAVEVRNFKSGSRKGHLDEVVAANVRLFHLEYMDDGHVWIGLVLADGSNFHVNLFTNSKAWIFGRAEAG